MSQSLLNRFRGSLLGSIIAHQIIGKEETVSNWEIINEKIIIDLIHHETISAETCQLIFQEDEQLSCGELILKILPLILFFHETEYLLFENIEKIAVNNAVNNNIEQNMINDIILFQKIINLTLNVRKEPLKNSLTLIPFLEKIQTLLEDNTSLTELKKKFRQKTALDNNNLLLSLYCFYRTPDNFELSILQASQFNHPVIFGITATLSGAYNGYSGIPIPWRLTISPDKDCNRLYQHITQLWAKWAGFDDPLKTSSPLENESINSIRMNNH